MAWGDTNTHRFIQRSSKRVDHGECTGPNHLGPYSFRGLNPSKLIDQWTAYWSALRRRERDDLIEVFRAKIDRRIDPVLRSWLGWICASILLFKVVVYGLAWLNSASVDARFFEGSKPRIDFNRIKPGVLNLASQDVLWYLEIVSRGYSSGRDSGAFYPAWPFFLRWIGCADSAWSPLIAAGASTVFWCLGLMVVFHWASRTLSRPVAWSMVLANLLLPSSMTFWIGFTESLFFFLFVSFMAFADDRRLWVSWVAAILLPITRPVGVFVVIIPGVWWLLGHRRAFAAKCIVGFFLGWSIYFGIMWHHLGHPFAGWAAQRFHVNAPSLAYVTDLPRFLASLCHVTSFHDPTGSLLDRLVFIASFWGVVRLWRIRPSWCVATAAMLLIPAMTNQFLSFSRFSIVAIPLLLPIGQTLLRLRPRWLCLCVGLSLATQYHLIHRFFSFGWGT